MKSKITGGPLELVFTLRVLNKYDVKYFRCLETGFIQTEEPYWLDEAYSSAITKLDIGMLSRNEYLRDQTIKLISGYFNADQRFLDYAGGYGIFTRLMRDKGYDYYHSDIYCQNIFAEYFDLKDCPDKNGFELVTAFEVFEHLVNPKEEIQRVLGFSDHLFFTTELQPEELKNNLPEWWYIAPETGQHIALYTLASLRYMAKEMGYNFYSDGKSMHLFTRNEFRKDPFTLDKEPYLIRTMRRKLSRHDRKIQSPKESLLLKDFDAIKGKLRL
ncbi:class I SAM-dependent methyltransferase [Pedobacter caeni]|uniref:Methyltransferase domain-containing protein n=1 Tax=Pedobacter caeni TaxID=288992 RepID=A0A1M5D1S2_9SPHI|nr:class I SAM-dependent methyltransferase [Pedobacter caeni]SHF60983.1 Methyltransferase domain-containing protein [Pedobacter caeni]